jgi:hypothetical protein
MSAFVVDRKHIDALVTAALDGCPLRQGSPVSWYFPSIERPGDTLVTLQEKRRTARQEDASRIGAMLWAENVNSVNHRYTEDEWEDVYEYRRYTGTLPAVQVLKAIDCYVYQSCEHDGWETSEAKQFCESLRHAYIGLLPGYSDAEWSISH